MKKNQKVKKTTNQIDWTKVLVAIIEAVSKVTIAYLAIKASL